MPEGSKANFFHDHVSLMILPLSVIIDSLSKFFKGGKKFFESRAHHLAHSPCGYGTYLDPTASICRQCSSARHYGEQQPQRPYDWRAAW